LPSEPLVGSPTGDVLCNIQLLMDGGGKVEGQGGLWQSRQMACTHGLHTCDGVGSNRGWATRGAAVCRDQGGGVNLLAVAVTFDNLHHQVGV
jgi:hypothetical protein